LAGEGPLLFATDAPSDTPHEQQEAKFARAMFSGDVFMFFDN